MKKILLASLIISCVSICLAQSNKDLKLWYNKPSGTIWENALPIGNGKLGAMVYGNVDTETVQLNECTVWSGSPNRNGTIRLKTRCNIYDN
jgi:alpha-L-fucosidase 2